MAKENLAYFLYMNEYALELCPRTTVVFLAQRDCGCFIAPYRKATRTAFRVPAAVPPMIAIKFSDMVGCEFFSCCFAIFSLSIVSLINALFMKACEYCILQFFYMKL